MKNIVRLLSNVAAGIKVYVLLRERRSRESVIINDIEKFVNVSIIEPMSCLNETFSDEAIHEANLLNAIAAAQAGVGTFDFVICRGTGFATVLAADPAIRNRLIVYWTGISKAVILGEEPLLRKLSEGGVKIIAQTRIVKAMLEVFGGVYSGNIAVIPPMVDSSTFKAPSEAVFPSRDVMISYSGKIDKDYLVLDLLKLSGSRLGTGGVVKAEILAGKLTRHQEDRNFLSNWHAARAEADPCHVTFYDDTPHSAVAERMKMGDFAWCIRSSKYDSSAEISTKMLEYAALGVPPILNKTPVNEEVFGKDYPLFIRSSREALGIIDKLLSAPESDQRDLQDFCKKTAARYDITHSIPTMRRLLNLDMHEIIEVRPRPYKVLVAGHDLKFMDRILHRLRSVPEIDLSFDRWKSSKVPETDRSRISCEADVIFCEWCCENAVWFSHNKPPNSRLIVRLHRFEAFRDFPSRLAWQNVDDLIVVSEYFRDLCVKQFGVPEHKITVFPQFIETTELDRPKHDRARHVIGMVGINPFNHKRFDRALDLMKRVVELDSSMLLRVRSVMPWELSWVWSQQSSERDLYERLFSDLKEDPSLSGRVIFDRPGTDMEEWYREVGFILSSSDSEGCHTSVLEGMASGCIPIVYNWPGARSLFPKEFVYDDLTCAAEDVVKIASSSYADKMSDNMKSWVSRFDADEFLRLLQDLIFKKEKVS
jgi:glycosyltransferase involved in cell wall biosynthesis